MKTPFFILNNSKVKPYLFTFYALYSNFLSWILMPLLFHTSKIRLNHILQANCQATFFDLGVLKKMVELDVFNRCGLNKSSSSFFSHHKYPTYLNSFYKILFFDVVYYSLPHTALQASSQLTSPYDSNHLINFYSDLVHLWIKGFHISSTLTYTNSVFKSSFSISSLQPIFIFVFS